MRESRYNIFLRKNDQVYAMNLLSRAAVVLSTSSYDTIMKFTENPQKDRFSKSKWKLIQWLQENLFFCDDDFDELAYIRYRYHETRFDKSQLGLVVVPTTSCNFSCHYCFEQKEDSQISSESQNRLLALVAANAPNYQELHVQWFGGEPLRELGIVQGLSEKLIELCRELNMGYTAELVTNGFLLTEVAAKELKRFGVVKVQIPLDGMREGHDQVRFEDPVQGSFDRIISNIRKASPYLRVNVRIHVTMDNFEDVHELIDYLARQGMQEDISELYFAPLFNYCANMADQPFRHDSELFMTSSEFARVQYPLLKHAGELGFGTPEFLDSSYGICTAVKANTLIVDSTGDLLKCYMDVGNMNEAVGTLLTGLKPSQKLFQWLDYDFWANTECKECQFLPLCLGGCPKQRLLGAPQSTICTPLRFNATDLINLYFESIDESTKSTTYKF